VVGICSEGPGHNASALYLALLYALIHPSRWNKNSRKFISKILHSLIPAPLKTPAQAPCIAPLRYRL
jgi:hypothetical protein